MYLNAAARSWSGPSPSQRLNAAYDFHRSLPDYHPTELIPLPQVAKELGVKVTYLKDEGKRLGLSSFKILGASWGTDMALTRLLGLPHNVGLDPLREALQQQDTPPELYAATDGNHGRAVARMGAILGLLVCIFVPSGLDKAAIEAIEAEGPHVRVIKVNGSYDDTVKAVFMDSAAQPTRILIQDTASKEYEEAARVSPDTLHARLSGLMPGKVDSGRIQHHDEGNRRTAGQKPHSRRRPRRSRIPGPVGGGTLQSCRERPNGGPHGGARHRGMPTHESQEWRKSTDSDQPHHYDWTRLRNCLFHSLAGAAGWGRRKSDCQRPRSSPRPGDSVFFGH